MSQTFEAFLRRFEEANTAFVNGDPSLWMPLVSHSEQSSIFGGFGGHEVGWSQIGPRYEWASAQFAAQRGEGRVRVPGEACRRRHGVHRGHRALHRRATSTQPAPSTLTFSGPR